MTVSTSINKVSYKGNGIVKEFAIPFYFLDASDIEIWLVSETIAERKLELGSEYAVFGSGNLNGGSVTLTFIPANGERLTILRNVAMTQEVDYRENEIFPAETQERALDKLTMITQQNAEKLTRTLTLGVTSEENPDEIIPRIFEAETESQNSFLAAKEAELGAKSYCEEAGRIVDGFDEHAAEKQQLVDAGVSDARSYGTRFSIVTWR